MDQPTPSLPPQPALTPQQEFLALLRRQNELLESIQHNQLAANSTRVIDFNMSIGAMIAFMFKWIIASIPIAIIFGLIWLLASGVLIGLIAALSGGR